MECGGTCEQDDDPLDPGLSAVNKNVDDAAERA